MFWPRPHSKFLASVSASTSHFLASTSALASSFFGLINKPDYLLFVFTETAEGGCGGWHCRWRRRGGRQWWSDAATVSTTQDEPSLVAASTREATARSVRLATQQWWWGRWGKQWPAWPRSADGRPRRQCICRWWWWTQRRWRRQVWIETLSASAAELHYVLKKCPPPLQLFSITTINSRKRMQQSKKT